MNSVKMFFEEGRTTIVIDNPSTEMNMALQKKFSGAVEEISTLLAPAEEKVLTPEVPPMEMKAVKETVQSKEGALQNQVYDIFDLIENVALQKQIGLDQTILSLATSMRYNADSVKKWLISAPHQEKIDRYNFLRSKVIEHKNSLSH